MISHFQVQVMAGAGIRSRRASRRCLSSIRKISYFPFRENFLGWYDVFVISSVSAMRKIPVVLLIAGLASFAVGCSHNKQKIVFVTEFISCEGWSDDFVECSTAPGSTGGAQGKVVYRGYNNSTASNAFEAASSICKGISMFKSEFTDKVNSDEFRVLSTTDWVDDSQSYKVNWSYSGGSGVTDYGVRCIGKEYVVSY